MMTHGPFLGDTKAGWGNTSGRVGNRLPALANHTASNRHQRRHGPRARQNTVKHRWSTAACRCVTPWVPTTSSRRGDGFSLLFINGLVFREHLVASNCLSDSPGVRSRVLPLNLRCASSLDPITRYVTTVTGRVTLSLLRACYSISPAGRRDRHAGRHAVGAGEKAHYSEDKPLTERVQPPLKCAAGAKQAMPGGSAWLFISIGYPI